MAGERLRIPDMGPAYGYAIRRFLGARCGGDRSAGSGGLALAGGDDAAPGQNWIERADGSVEMLAATGSADLGAGDAFVIETPGGGGYGKTGER